MAKDRQTRGRSPIENRWLAPGLACVGLAAALVLTFTVVIGGEAAHPAISAAAATIAVLTAVIMQVVAILRFSRSKHGRLASVAHDLRPDEDQDQEERRQIPQDFDLAAASFELGPDGKVTGWDSGAVTMFGRTAEEMVGTRAERTLFGPVFPSLSNGFFAELWTSRNTDDAPLDIRGFHCNGRELTLEARVRGSEVDDAGSLRVLLRDVTKLRFEQKEAERASRDERKLVLRLQELEKAKTDFVSSVSHELRSPLTSILGYLELLAEGDAGELAPEQNRMVEIAMRNSKRLQGLIEDLLTLSRIESGSFEVKFHPVDILSVVKTAVEKSARAARERGVTLDVQTVGEIGACPGDEVQLIRAIGNLVDNAVKFSPHGREVLIEVRGIDDRVAIAVSDNGMGITIEEQSHLFERFYRAPIAVEQAHHGTGLGLTIAKAIIDHHGGNIAISSTVGVGTTVTIALPSVPVTPVPGSPPVTLH